MIDFHVDPLRCTRCGLCVADCPSRIISLPAGGVPLIAPEDESFCIRCQHCLAICPAAAVRVLGRDPADSLALTPAALPDLDQMERLVRGRRSVRRYLDENVPPEVVKRLLAALANAPTGVNRRELTFTLIDDRAVMQRFRERLLNALRTAAGSGRLPQGPSYLTQAVPAWFERGEDIILRGAPHLLVVSAPADAPCPAEDVPLALAFFDLLAQSAGLGTVWCGMLKMALETLPELKPMLRLAPGRLYYAMLFGRPAVRYPRTVQRDDAARIRLARVPATAQAGPEPGNSGHPAGIG